MVNSKYLSREERNTTRKAEKRQKLYKNERIQREKNRKQFFTHREKRQEQETLVVEVMYIYFSKKRRKNKNPALKWGVINFSSVKRIESQSWKKYRYRFSL